jgi:hypothetical protein
MGGKEYAMTKKKKWLLGIGGGILLLLAWIVLLSPWVWPGGGIDSLVISKETTWLTNPPMKPNGTVNYAQYVADRSTEGVTPENNALACFTRALGPMFLWRITDTLHGAERTKAYLGFDPKTLEGPSLRDASSALREVLANLEAAGRPDAKYLVYELCGIPWTQAEYPEIKQWLDAYAAPLDWLIKASRKERYSYWPLIRLDDPNTANLLLIPTPSFRRLIPVGDLMAIRSMYKLGEGDIEGAWSDTMALRRIARLISQDSHLVSQLMGCSMETSATMSQLSILRVETLTVSQARSMLAELQSLAPLPLLGEAMERNLFVELNAATMLMGLSAEDYGEMSLDPESTIQWYARWVDPNRVLRTITASWEPMIHRSSLPTMLQRKAAGVEYASRFEKQPLLEVTTGTVTRFLLDAPSVRRRILTDLFVQALPRVDPFIAYAKVQDNVDVNKTYISLTETMAALAVYRAEKGQWPGSLSDLVPAILPAVPVDPWSKDDASLIYKRTPEGFILYSIGYNETDDGGKDNYEREEDDIVVSDPKQEDE